MNVSLHFDHFFENAVYIGELIDVEKREIQQMEDLG